MNTRTRTRTWALGALVALAITGAVGSATAAGPRLVVTMDEPFVVGGEVFPAGELSVRPLAAYNPTTTLNEVWVGNRCLGLLMASRRDDPGLEASRNAVLFGRDDDGNLVLRGFAYRAAGPGDRYRYELLETREVTATTSVDAAGVLVAARARR